MLAAAVATPRSLARVGTDGGDRSGSGVADDTDAWFVFEGTLSKEGSARLLRDKRKWGPAVSVLGMTLEENKQTKKSLVEPSQAGDAGWCYNSITPSSAPHLTNKLCSRVLIERQIIARASSQNGNLLYFMLTSCCLENQK